MPHADLDLTTNRIVIRTEYRDRNLIRELPGARWNANERTWSLPVSWVACKHLRAIFGDTLTVSPMLYRWAADELEDRIRHVTAAHTAAEDPHLDTSLELTRPELYPFQRTGIGFLTAARQAILADEMGTGKTVQTITTLEELPDAYPALIVCPSSVKSSWAREFTRWAPLRSLTVIGGTATQRRRQLETETDVTIINYDAVRFHSRLAPYGSIALSDKEKTPGELNARVFRTVVADEAHRLKDPKSKQTRAVKAAAVGSVYRYALTGTPIANRPDELWSLLHFIAPTEWPSYTRFVDRYCDTSWNGYATEVHGIAPTTRDEFYELLDLRFLRRSKALVLPQLPAKVYEIRETPMSARQARAYRTMEDEFVSDVTGGTLTASTVLTRAVRLGQLAASECELDPETGTVRMVAPSNKVNGLLEILDDLDPEEKVVVFAEHRQLVDVAAGELETRGISYGRITGAENDHERDAAVDGFQNGNLRVILVTLGAGGVGLTLHAARIAVFLERSWSLVQNRQAEDRIHRIGQTGETVLIVDLVAPGTIDEARLGALDEKGRKLEEITRDAATLAAALYYRKPPKTSKTKTKGTSR